MENETIFRDKSIERVSSPDQLNEYIKLSNPGVWFVLTAILLILVGAVIFGTFGHIDSTVPGVGISTDGKMVCLVKKEYGDRFTEDMKARVDDGVYGVSLRSNGPVTVWDNTAAYALTVGGLQPGEWVYELDADGFFPDGVYEIKLITERISPLSFLFNSNEKQ
ncbi:MAG: hypothetical protein IJT16_06500 [Lachnospiraceae bacterium]|nr:hypothetical protein [Lachnospiraceae bacterium]MBQ8970536.1 hypothetical protein [Lachnospiraceae bacterium]MBR2275030.1 hypothetical protein [Lachnospiraceae bacterium]